MKNKMRLGSLESWGPAAWRTMHAISFSYPTTPTANDRVRFHAFLWALAEVLPCSRCRADWTTYLRTHAAASSSYHLDSRDALTRFLVDGHNYVNMKLNKRCVTYDTVHRMHVKGCPQYPQVFLRCAVCAIGAAVCLAIVRLSQGRVTRRDRVSR